MIGTSADMDDKSNHDHIHEPDALDRDASEVDASKPDATEVDASDLDVSVMTIAVPAEKEVEPATGESPVADTHDTEPEMVHANAKVHACFSEDGESIIVTSAGSGFSEPNYAKKYALPDPAHDDDECECDQCDAAASLLTPRNALVLLYVAQSIRIMIDEEPGWLMESLPPIAGKRKVTFEQKFLPALDRISAALENNQYPEPNSTGEEMLLHILIAEATEAYKITQGTSQRNPLEVVAALLPVCRSDGDFEMMSEMWFEDHDVLMLFDPRLKGIQNSPTAELLGMVNLNPKDWFKPFRA